MDAGRIHRVAAPGWTLIVEADPPPPGLAPWGVVVAGHAMMCDRRTLDRPRGAGLAGTLAAAGLYVYRFDARGHGESGPGAHAGGRWSYDDLALGDLPAVVAWARARHPDLPLAVVGHSLMGHAALLWLGQAPAAPVDAVVTLGANVWVRSLEPSAARWLVKRATAEVWWAVTAALGRFPARRIGMGTDDEALDYVGDLCRWTRRSACRRRADGADYLAGLARVRAPVLALAGGADRLLCHPEAARRFHAPIPDHEVRVIPGVDHMGLVLDPRMRPAWRAAADWLRARLGA